MKIHQPAAFTDTALSLAASEFVWTSAEESQVHKDVGRPLLSELRAANAQSVLDIGCGNGALSGRLQREGFDVTGCDASASGIALAQRHFGGSAFFRHDVCEPLPPEHVGRYDAVVSIEVIEHLILPRLLIMNALQALRPGGLLIVSTPYHGYLKNLALALTGKFDEHWHPLRDFGHVKFFSPKTITQLLSEEGFRVRALRRVGRVPVLARSMIVAAHKYSAAKDAVK